MKCADSVVWDAAAVGWQLGGSWVAAQQGKAGNAGCMCRAGQGDAGRHGFQGFENPKTMKTPLKTHSLLEVQNSTSMNSGMQ
jgi:hypothetical protein